MEPASDSAGWRSPLGVLLAVLGILVGISVAKTATALASPCRMFLVMRGLDVCREDVDIVMHLTQAGLFVGMVGLFLDFSVKLWWTIRLQQHWPLVRRMFRWLPGAGSPLEADNWVPAATRSFFLETAESVRYSRALAVLLQLPTILLALLRLVPVLLDVLDGSEGDYDLPSLCQQLNAGSSTVCQVMIWRRFALQLSWAPVYILVIIFLAIPRLMWGPVAEEAAAAYKDVGLMRLGMLPWLLIPLMGANAATGVVFYFWLWADEAVVSEALLLMWFAGCCVCLVWGLLIVVWTQVLQETWELVRRRLRMRYRAVRHWAFRTFYAGSTHNNVETAWSSAMSTDAEASPKQSLRINVSLAALLSSSSEEAHAVQDTHVDFSSAHHQRLVLLNTAIFLFGSVDATSRTDTIALGVMRVVTILAILLIKDKQSSHSDLRHHSAALGLVLDAKALARALRMCQQGGPLIEHIPHFRATILRMRRTLAVSYRWQHEAISITADGVLSLNMSRFQVQALMDEIPRSGCSFVWIDKLSVFQQRGSELQNKLLSRMLAVFSGAQATLAIRSLEDADASRYHRRAWTAQEYCCARKLVVVSEEPSADGPNHSRRTCLSDTSASTEEEICYFDKLRREVQRELSHCRPYWLLGSEVDSILTAANAASIIRKYADLSARVNCLNREDKLRALCPMIANIPVDGQHELLALIRRIDSAAPSGMVLDESGTLLLMHSDTLRKAAPGRCSLHDGQAPRMSFSHSGRVEDVAGAPIGLAARQGPRQTWHALTIEPAGGPRAQPRNSTCPTTADSATHMHSRHANGRRTPEEDGRSFTASPGGAENNNVLPGRVMLATSRSAE